MSLYIYMSLIYMSLYIYMCTLYKTYTNACIYIYIYVCYCVYRIYIYICIFILQYIHSIYLLTIYLYISVLIFSALLDVGYTSSCIVFASSLRRDQRHLELSLPQWHQIRNLRLQLGTQRGPLLVLSICNDVCIYI